MQRCTQIEATLHRAMLQYVTKRWNRFPQSLHCCRLSTTRSITHISRTSEATTTNDYSSCISTLYHCYNQLGSTSPTLWKRYNVSQCSAKYVRRRFSHMTRPRSPNNHPFESSGPKLSNHVLRTNQFDLSPPPFKFSFVPVLGIL